MALVGIPEPDPGNLPDPNAVVEASAFIVLIIGFFALIRQGYPAHEALGITTALGLGGARVIRHLRGGDDRRGQR